MEEPNAKRLGPGYRIIQHCALKDCRNKPRFDDKGKVIKQKKGTPIAKSLTPDSLSAETERVITWFNTKMRPHSQHLFNVIITRPD